MQEAQLTKLDCVPLEEGAVLHAIKDIDSGYVGFQEAYFSEIYPGQIKGWKRHKLMTLNLVVPVGSVRFVLFDDRSPSKTSVKRSEFLLSRQQYFRLTVPPMIWVAFQGLDKAPSLVLNVANLRHDPEEIDRLDLDQIVFDWHFHQDKRIR